MKRNLLTLFTVITVAVFLGGCSKVLTTEDRLAGSWQLLYAEKEGYYSTQTIYTGLEDGTFYFYDNGEAEYDDGVTLLRGNWRLRWVQDGYYDGNGQYLTSSHQVFSLQLANFQENKVLNWEFDDSGFKNRDLFKATYYTSNYTYRYVFARL